MMVNNVFDDIVRSIFELNNKLLKSAVKLDDNLYINKL